MPAETSCDMSVKRSVVFIFFLCLYEKSDAEYLFDSSLLGMSVLNHGFPWSKRCWDISFSYTLKGVWIYLSLLPQVGEGGGVGGGM